MLLRELKATGTYVAVVPVSTTLALLQEWALQNCVQLDDHLHVTTLYSRVPLSVTTIADEFHATPLSFARFGKALVLKLDAPSIEARHEQFIQQGGTHDFKDFTPHLTIQADSKLQPEDLPVPGFGLIFGNEYTEALVP